MSNARESLDILTKNPVLIYGAGITGRRIAVGMKELGVNVIGVAVTSMDSNVNTLGGYPVKEIDCWKGYAGKAVVMVATLRDHKAIIQTCKSFGFEDLVIMDQALQDVFFSLYFKSILSRHQVNVSGKSLQMGGGSI